MKEPKLLAGDTLVYGMVPGSVADIVIAYKTWCREAVHVEIYVGQGKSIASRAGRNRGVNIYPVRYTQLTYVRRPVYQEQFCLEGMLEWFRQPYDPVDGTGIRGQGYDYVGLLCFALAVKQGSPDKMFCSEFWTRAHRAANYDVIAPDWDADKVAPTQSAQTPMLRTVWRLPGLRACLCEGA